MPCRTIKRHSKVLEETVHAKQASNRQIVLESNPCNYRPTWNIEGHVVQICAFDSTNTHRLLDRA